MKSGVFCLFYSFRDINTTVSTVIQNFQLFSGRIPDDVVRIVIDLNFLSATTAETTATYQVLREYILTTYGLHVSNLYISQIKHKCGLDMRPNYNLPKSENSRVPTCPPEKETAIVGALRHFKMI